MHRAEADTRPPIWWPSPGGGGGCSCWLLGLLHVRAPPRNRCRCELSATSKDPQPASSLPVTGDVAGTLSRVRLRAQQPARHRRSPRSRPARPTLPRVRALAAGRETAHCGVKLTRLAATTATLQNVRRHQARSMTRRCVRSSVHRSRRHCKLKLWERSRPRLCKSASKLQR